MSRILRFSLIGCGGLIVLFVILGIIGALIGGGTDTANKPKPEPKAQSSDNASKTSHKAQEQQAEKKQKQADQAAKDAKAQALQAKQQAAEAEQAKKAAADKAKKEAAKKSSGEAKVLVRVTGDAGVPFSGSYGNLDTIRSVDGTTPQEYEVKGIDTGLFSADSVSANAQKSQAGGQTITVQIIYKGKVAKEASTSAEYGLAQASWSPSE